MSDAMRVMAWICVMALGCLGAGCEMGGGSGGGGFPFEGDMGAGPVEQDDDRCFVDPPTADYPFAVDSCTGREICIDGFCEPAFGRRYGLGLYNVIVPERKLNGDCWDAFCGAPDPFANVYVDGDFVGGAPTIQDTFDARWDIDLGRVTVIDGSQLVIEVFDADVSEHDGITICTIDLEAEFLRRRVFVCQDEAATLALTGVIVP